MADPAIPASSVRVRSARARAWGPAVVGAACAVAGLALASQHPLSGVGASLVWVGVAAAAWRWPAAWPGWLPATIPVAGLMPWSGWMVVEELDLLVLAAAAGGYLSWAGGERTRRRSTARLLAPVVLLMFGLSIVVAVQRGVADAGGWQFGWWQGYREPLNSVRLAKSFFMVLLLWPLWRRAERADAPGARRRLVAGMAFAMGLVGGLCLWERAAYPGLTNFSTDYRIVALFWEMHVGGAALDAFLALTMPFGLAALIGERSAWRWGLGALALALAAYACLVTFSRIDYVAIPVGLATMGALVLQQRRRRGIPALAGAGAIVVAAAAFALAAAWTFGTGGYRVMLGLLGAVAALLVLGHRRGPATRRTAAAVPLIALAAIALAAAVSAVESKAVYALFALLWFAIAAAAWRRAGWLAVGLYPGLLAALVAVAAHWGGEAAAWRAAAPAAVLAVVLVAVVATGRVPWPASLRWGTSTLGVMAGCAALVGTFGGGAYMHERLASATDDAQARLLHWSHVLQLLEGPEDWLLGKGIGRFPERIFHSRLSNDYRTGDARLVAEGRRTHVVMTGGQHALGWGELFRLSQRVAAPAGQVTAEFEARADRAVELHLELCEKHLLYNGACLVRNVKIPAKPGEWQSLALLLPGDLPTRGSWWAPRFVAFAVGVESPGGRIEARDFRLRGPDGADLLTNGDFSRGLAHWFVTSDRYHTPWHEKSLFLHLLVAQGILGVVLFSALVLGAAWRLVLGSARDLELAPPLAGALAGFLAVGLIDSLLDVPRVAFVFYLLLLVALTVPNEASRTGRTLNA